MTALAAGTAMGLAAPERRGSDSVKWGRFAPDVLPLWVADLDFAVAPCIADALAERVAHGVFGYAAASDSLRARIVERLQARHGWTVAAEQIVFLPGVVAGLEIALGALLAEGDTVAVQLPAYPPLLQAPVRRRLRRRDLRLRLGDDGWGFDSASVRQDVAGAQAFLLCNPHNPTGKVYDRGELGVIAEACLAGGALIIADEVHCDLLHDGRRHLPIASLDPEVGRRSITLMSAGKTYGIAGLRTAWAIIPDPVLRAAFTTATGWAEGGDLLGLVATEAAYAGGAGWEHALMATLHANRASLVQAVAAVPGLAMQPPQASYVGWIDCGDALPGRDAQAWLLEHARVAASPGAMFDPASPGWIRLNFGCPAALLATAVDRITAALAAGRDLSNVGNGP